MNSPLFPAEIAAVILAEILFGIGFNRMVNWAHTNKIWHVSISVVIGVSVSVLIPTLLWWRLCLDFWLSAVLMTVCFAASGIPVVKVLGIAGGYRLSRIEPAPQKMKMYKQAAA